LSSPEPYLAVAAKIIKGAILGLAIFPRIGLHIKAGLKSSRGRKTAFDRISELRPEKKETKAFLERMFAHYQEFAGLKLLEHDATFTYYAAHPPFYVIRIVYRPDLGYENYNGPSELYLIVKPTDNPEVCLTVILWTADSFDRWLNSMWANDSDGLVKAPDPH
jgi:hypothetical protein